MKSAWVSFLQKVKKNQPLELYEYEIFFKENIFPELFLSLEKN